MRPSRTTCVSLGQAFASGFLAFQNPVKPAFALALLSGFLTLVSRPLSTSDIFSEVYRPSQTAHLLMSRIASVSCIVVKG